MGFGDLQCSLPATREGAPLDPVPKRRGAQHRARGKKKAQDQRSDVKQSILYPSLTHIHWSDPPTNSGIMDFNGF